jgi:hypothetical protein
MAAGGSAVKPIRENLVGKTDATPRDFSFAVTLMPGKYELESIEGKGAGRDDRDDRGYG